VPIARILRYYFRTHVRFMTPEPHKGDQRQLNFPADDN
jgi:hypothetical protein